MRIQHNIMAMNAYRNYTNNVAAMKKNLEKLSSGYKINRAGDDAAGLAISEKMRAQITGLEAAQKNAKDGISLVQTAEGALTEVHDMLNRMVELATQSANGTYDNTTDRFQLQKEMDQLRTEINRIADSANFNGIKLFDGSMDAEGSKDIQATTFTGVRDALVEATGFGQGWEVIKHQEGTSAAKTSFEIDFSNLAVNLGSEGSATVTFGLSAAGNEALINPGGATAADYPDDRLHGLKIDTADSITEVAGTADDATNAGWQVTVDSDAAGKITGADIAKKLAEHLQTATSSDKKNTIVITNNAGTAVEYKVSVSGNKLKFEMTDDGFTAATNGYNDGDKTAFNGNFNVGMNIKIPDTKEYADTDDTTTTGDAAVAVATGKYFTDKACQTAAVAGDFTANTKLYTRTGDEYTVTAVDGTTGKITMTGTTDAPTSGLTNLASSNIKKGSVENGTVLADVLLAPNGTNGWGQGDILDGSGVRIGDTSYIFAGTNETFEADYSDNVKVVDIRDIFDKDTGLVKGANEGANTALSRLTEAANDNKMWHVELTKNNGNGFLSLREKNDYNGDGKDGRADLTTAEGIKETLKYFHNSRAHSTDIAATGRALTLQIGDTAEDFNQLKVNIKDMHAASLGLDKISIADQDSAAKAIDVIKAAINTVSDVRGTLGATQNRLDHTINNLSVMTENIQDAESTIRDTDVADEMMAYTKNNILIQSAQAMLAQANQVPQGVLQLLQ